jgi:broad specificity phosphatase PhoE
VDIARRMLAAVYRARAAADGHEAVCVSHQLPIWTLRRFLEAKPLWHDPRRRQCSLASITSLVFEDDQLTDIVYAEPAGTTEPKVTGA